MNKYFTYYNYKYSILKLKFVVYIVHSLNPSKYKIQDKVKLQTIITRKFRSEKSKSYIGITEWERKSVGNIEICIRDQF